MIKRVYIPMQSLVEIEAIALFFIDSLKKEILRLSSFGDERGSYFGTFQKLSIG